MINQQNVHVCVMDYTVMFHQIVDNCYSMEGTRVNLHLC